MMICKTLFDSIIKNEASDIISVFIMPEIFLRYNMKNMDPNFNQEGTKYANHILVKFKDEATKESVKKHVHSKFSLKMMDLKRSLRFSGAELLELHEEDNFEKVVDELHNHPEVLYAQADHHLYACSNDDLIYNENQWGIRNSGQQDKFENTGVSGIDINAVNAWKISRGTDTIVAVIDTGVDIQHADLKDNIYHNTSEKLTNNIDNDGNNYIDDVTGWDFANKDNTVYDSVKEDKHGTEVAGIIAGEGINSGVIGVAPMSRIIPLKFMSHNSGTTSCAIEAIEYAKAKGVKIVNCSWGDYKKNPALKHHIENSGMLFICAAGNDGIDISKKPFYPACYDLPNIISVAAINNRGELWPMSNYGSNVHLAAPGSSILSTIPSKDENSYDFDSGTSLATPYVTGVAALISSKYSNLKPEEIKNLILKNVTKLNSLEGKVSTGGIVDAYKSLIS
jgi:subtilisin family serine protease